MAKIDRLGWAAGFSFMSYGARIGIRVNDPTILDRLLEFLPPRWNPSSSSIVDVLYSLLVGGQEEGSRVRRYHLLYSGAARLARTKEIQDIFNAFESDVHFQVEVRARRTLFVHAGVVGWRGRAIVIPGRSQSGKTSLVEALVRAGATYYSDEYAVFDRSGRVHPYPKPLSVREELKATPKRVPIEVLGGREGTTPLPVGLVAVTAYQPNKRWRPRVLTPGQALLALLDNTVLARIRSEFALHTLQLSVPSALTLEGTRGEAKEVAELLLERCDRSWREGQLGGFETAELDTTAG